MKCLRSEMAARSIDPIELTIFGVTVHVQR
jgi:hypothetical protein